MNINTQLHIFLTRIRLVRSGMGWVHHSWLSSNPPICWMRQNMANGHPGLRSLEDMSLPVWDTESTVSAWTRWHIMFVMVTHCPDLGAQRTQTWLLSVKAVKDLLFPWSGSLVRRRGHSHSDYNIFTKTWLSRKLERYIAHWEKLNNFPNLLIFMLQHWLEYLGSILLSSFPSLFKIQDILGWNFVLKARRSSVSYNLLAEAKLVWYCEENLILEIREWGLLAVN